MPNTGERFLCDKNFQNATQNNTVLGSVVYNRHSLVHTLGVEYEVNEWLKTLLAIAKIDEVVPTL